MKIISIGRGEDCDIRLVDENNLISRNHAILRIHSSGKMDIVSSGQNGTFKNGQPIKNGVPVAVTRKDHISFAHERDLDWTMVKNPVRPWIVALYSVLALLVIGGGGYAIYRYLVPDGSNDMLYPSGGNNLGEGGNPLEIDSVGTNQHPLDKNPKKKKTAKDFFPEKKTTPEDTVKIATPEEKSSDTINQNIIIL